jgi:uncharacterized protein (TIGR02265 family)
MREALRRLGRDAYDTFVASMVGKVVMGVAGRDWHSAVKLVGRAYSVVGNTSSASSEALGERESRIKVSGVWNFPDCYHVGVLEAAMQDYEIPGAVQICAHTPESFTYRLSW